MNRRFRAITAADVSVLLNDADLGESAWIEAAQRRWGCCGVVSGSVAEPSGWVLVAPVNSLPDDHPLTTRASGGDLAGLIALKTTGVDRACPRQLIQALAGRLVGTVPGIEAVAASWRPESAWTDGLLPSVSALESAGFEKVAEGCSVIDPLMRLDLHSTVLAHWTDRAREWAPSWWTRVPPAEPSRLQSTR